MGKNIKSYATIPKVHFPREREGYLTAKSPNLSAKIWYGLTVHIRFFVFFKFTSKIFQIYVLSFGKISSELYKFHAIRPKILRIMQNSHRLSTIHYTFRCLTSGRELSEIPANQVKFAPFAHKSRELREICTIYSSTSSSLLSDL